jgi:hypothetical protein
MLKAVMSAPAAGFLKSVVDYGNPESTTLKCKNSCFICKNNMLRYVRQTISFTEWDMVKAVMSAPAAGFLKSVVDSGSLRRLQKPAVWAIKVQAGMIAPNKLQGE